MSKKVTIETIENVLKEMDKAVIFKNRTSSDIEDLEVKALIEKGSEVALKNNPMKYGIALGVGGLAAGGGAAIAGAVIGGGAAAGGGAAIAGIGSGVVAAKAGAAAGAAAGAPVPVIGPIVGGAAGIVVGAIVGVAVGKKRKNKIEALHKEVLEKQNGAIKALNEELEELSKKNEIKDNEIERLKYILGCITAFNDIEAVCA